MHFLIWMLMVYQTVWKANCIIGIWWEHHGDILGKPKCIIIKWWRSGEKKQRKGEGLPTQLLPLVLRLTCLVADVFFLHNVVIYCAHAEIMVRSIWCNFVSVDLSGWILSSCWDNEISCGYLYSLFCISMQLDKKNDWISQLHDSQTNQT